MGRIRHHLVGRSSTWDQIQPLTLAPCDFSAPVIVIESTVPLSMQQMQDVMQQARGLVQSSFEIFGGFGVLANKPTGQGSHQLYHCSSHSYCW